ncbi:glycosyltransferase family 87 protein [Roseomonas sp. CAU 1739]|uniref:glycosyltransferase family 87 protein n=1 Tax=Roseomonas sp. CAU 1739 TaxID=3140364 RepID=UPI00325ACE60
MAVVRWFREACWLTAGRAWLYGGILLTVPAIYLSAALVRVVGAGADAEPSLDFMAFHAASSLALGGDPAAAWDRLRHAAAQGLSPEQGYFPFLYPPPFLLLCLPLGLLPYAWSYLLWIVVTAVACILALTAYRPAPWPVVAVLCVLAPASVQNVANGQNAFLTTALFALVGLLLDRRPGGAAAALAVLACKPQLGLAVLPGLAAARRWRVILLGGLAVSILVGISWLVLGAEAWMAFFATMGTGPDALHSGQVPLWQMQSVQATLRGLGMPRVAAYVVQICATAAATVAIVVALRPRPGGRAEVAAMAAAAPLMTPYVFGYDLTLLLLPLAWILAEARRDGFLPWEKLGLALAYVLPGVSIGFVLFAGVGIGPVAALLVFGLVMRRIRVCGGAARLGADRV